MEFYKPLRHDRYIMTSCNVAKVAIIFQRKEIVHTLKNAER